MNEEEIWKISDWSNCRTYSNYIDYLAQKFPRTLTDKEIVHSWDIMIDSPSTQHYVCDMLRDGIIYVSDVKQITYIVCLTETGKDLVNLIRV